MGDEIVTSDEAILDLLRKSEAMTVAELARATHVTATAVRQRLNRLMAQGYVRRTVTRAGRGRPSHHYHLTAQGRRKTGANFADLAIALWHEIRAARNAELRRGLLQRVSQRLASQYSQQIEGATVEDKMGNLVEFFERRQVPLEVDSSGDWPVLKALACPYPELADQDRGVCAMERILFSELVGQELCLTQCRLDGPSCCTFEARI